jgi:hypothetical protein
MRSPLDLRVAGSVVAFDAEHSCSMESRAAIGTAVEILRDLVKADLELVTSGLDPVHPRLYLPPAWQLGLDTDFMTGMAEAMSAVTNGLQDVAWEGPVNLAEELCLKAIFDHAIDVVPEIVQVNDMDRLEDAVLYLQEVGFQDTDHEFLFEPEMDGIDQSDVGIQLGMQSLSRRDAFKRFANR